MLRGTRAKFQIYYVPYLSWNCWKFSFFKQSLSKPLSINYILSLFQNRYNETIKSLRLNQILLLKSKTIILTWFAYSSHILVPIIWIDLFYPSTCSGIIPCIYQYFTPKSLNIFKVVFLLLQTQYLKMINFYEP